MHFQTFLTIIFVVMVTITGRVEEMKIFEQELGRLLEGGEQAGTSHYKTLKFTPSIMLL